MSGYQTNGAGSPHTFLDTSDTNMYPATSQSAYFDEHQRTFVPRPTILEYSPVEERSQSSRNWSALNFSYPQHYQQVWSESIYSSASSQARTSNNSIFSAPHSRISTISTDSSSSGVSNYSRSHYLTHTERLLSGNPSPFTSHAPSPVEETAPPVTRKRLTPRTSTAAKDQYKTCVSRPQRARRTETVPKYFCTICKEHFGEKADWKRHEETFQERPDEFQCDNCDAKYFLDKDFVKHHASRHDCAPCRARTKCSSKKHVQESRRPRSMRSGWGCGFCVHFSSNWTERCNHIANHFDVGHKKMEDWDHSSVIFSLLQRPDIARAWETIVRSKHLSFTSFEWDSTATGRVEGYPDSNQTLQLQDELEYFKSGQDPAALAQKAFYLAKPQVECDIPPPVPPKHYRDHHKVSVQTLMSDTDIWNELMHTIPNDDHVATGITAPDDSSSWFIDETF